MYCPYIYTYGLLCSLKKSEISFSTQHTSLLSWGIGVRTAFCVFTFQTLITQTQMFRCCQTLQCETSWCASRRWLKVKCGWFIAIQIQQTSNLKTFLRHPVTAVHRTQIIDDLTAITVSDDVQNTIISATVDLTTFIATLSLDLYSAFHSLALFVDAGQRYAVQQEWANFPASGSHASSWQEARLPQR